ncbi:MAG: hypothetical protein ABI444_10305 [Candidatus Kapaibacterium sp.]|jgi:hypothetical protein
MNVTKSSQTIPLLLLLITLVMMATSADAQTTNGNLDANGMAFLKLNGASDAFALGDIHVAGIDASGGLRANPALLVGNRDARLGFAYGLLPTLGNTDLITASTTAGSDFSLGISAYILRNGELEVRTAPSTDPLSTSIPQNFAVGLTASVNIFDSLSVGMTIKWLNEKITIYNADGLGFDLGLHYIFSSEYQAAIAVQDLGSMSKLGNDATVLPGRATATFVAAPSFLSGSDIQTKFLLSHQIPLKGDVSHTSVGVAASYKNTVEARVGYVTHFDTRSITFGVGLRYKFLNFNYAFAPSINGFNSTNVFGLNVSF